ncbi:Glycosyl transferase family 2 [Salinimicrobium sediminis]|uniref:Glycosyl transferase family 2 n=1 Tax=Salinimicrobium sediminis TaxID=1343891 RepID=A0A285X1F4_9FLAO|nr:glycosyltransferase family A protein [Salinimicrobium sediminis]SOC78564.1 Glycosyl transferase family 2 [Salinimicrobium sediminis]
MFERPLVSVILPNYNHAAYLQERLDSILNQTYRNFELIILDDASTDQSLEIFEKYRDHEKVTQFLVNEINTGSPFVQWKKGLELARGEIIWIAESDDRCESNFLETQVQQLEGAGISVAKTLKFNQEGIQGGIQHPVFKENASIMGNEQILFCPVLNVSAIVFRAPALEEIARSQFSTFQLIGDRVFYFEFFQHESVIDNKETTAYFRKETSGLSNLKEKDLDYLTRYFEEHVRFIRLAAKKEKGALDQKVNPYIHRFFKRVRNRVSRKRKLSLDYFRLYCCYQSELIKTKILS